jgi:hypothetical protein
MTDQNVIERDLDAIDTALSTGAADHDDALARELQKLALALRADAPQPRLEFARELGERARAGFPRERRRRLNWSPRLTQLGVAGAMASVLIAIGVAATQLNGSNGAGSSADDGGAVVMDAPSSSERSAAPEASGQALDSAGGGAGGFEPAAPNRRIERSISMELESPADEMARLADQVTAVTNRHGGFVLSSSLSTGEEDSNGSFELRIPSERLQDALRELADLAPVLSQTQSGQDITREFVGTRGRLQAARAERRSLLRRLENADTDQEAEALRLRLDIVAAEINGLRGQLRDLRLRTDYAVVSVLLVADEEGSSSDEDGGAGAAFDDALGDAGDLLIGTAGVIVRVLALAVPLGVIGLLLWLAARALRRRRREQALA